MPFCKWKFTTEPDFRFWPFLAFFLLKRAEIDKNEENWQNPNRLMKFSEIWYVDASQQKKCYRIVFFYFSLFWPFFNQKTAKKTAKIKLPKSKLFDEIFWNLVCRCFSTKQNATIKLFLDFGLFWLFLNQKTAKIDQKWWKLTKSKPFDEIFWKFGM